MNRIIAANIIRFVGFLLLQGLVLKGITAEWVEFPYVQILLYPLFIILLPIRTPRPLVLLFAFLIGLSVDIFYNSPGVHASASLITAVFRPFIFKRLEPRGAYTAQHAPNKEKMGWNWFLQYASFLMAVHLLFYFSVESFTFAYLLNILLKTFFSFIFSMIFVLMFMQVFNPRE